MMGVSKKALDAAYRTGYEDGERGTRPSPGVSEHPHDRYWAMAHIAGWHDGTAAFERLAVRLRSTERTP